MRSVKEYVKCPCGGWAVIERAEDKSHRDRIRCCKCGGVTVTDNVPEGVRMRVKEVEDDD